MSRGCSRGTPLLPDVNAAASSSLPARRLQQLSRLRSRCFFSGAAASSLLRRRLRSGCDNSFLRARKLPKKDSHSKSRRRRRNCCLDGRSPLLSVQLRRCWIAVSSVRRRAQRLLPRRPCSHRRCCVGTDAADRIDGRSPRYVLKTNRRSRNKESKQNWFMYYHYPINQNMQQRYKIAAIMIVFVLYGIIATIPWFNNKFDDGELKLPNRSNMHRTQENTKFAQQSGSLYIRYDYSYEK